MRRRRKMLSAGELYPEPPWGAGWGTARSRGVGSLAFPASLALVRERGPAEGTLGKREADSAVLPLKPVLLSRQQRAPKGSAGALAGPWGVRVAVGCCVSPAGQWHPHGSQCGGTVLVLIPSARLELPKEPLLRWLNPLPANPAPWGDPNGMEPTALGPSCLQKSGLCRGVLTPAV